jgi:hypothetical protein
MRMARRGESLRGMAVRGKVRQGLARISFDMEVL